MSEIDISGTNLIVDTALNDLCIKFILMDAGDGSKGDEFWYLVLSNVRAYLREYQNNSKYKVLYKKYIDWFISEWPPQMNKKGEYKLSQYIPPPEVIPSLLD
jgi:hypothetical protein